MYPIGGLSSVNQAPQDAPIDCVGAVPLTKAKNSYQRFLKEAIGYTKVRAPGRLKRDAPRPLLLYMKLFSPAFRWRRCLWGRFGARADHREKLQ